MTQLDESSDNLAMTFAALADSTRFAMVQRLLDEGALSAGALAAATDLSAPAVSRHLKVLRTAGLVTQKVDGTRRIYAARPEPLRAISAWTGSHRAFWEGSLDRLERALNQSGWT